MRIGAMLVLGTVILVGCAGAPEGGVTNKILQDFGLRDRPEGYKTGADRVYARLNEVGAVELNRLNGAERQGTVKFEDTGGLHAKYYKEMKVYEKFYPVDSRSAGRSGDNKRGFVGYIDYSYRVFQSERTNTRTLATSARASIPTSETGRERFRYNFTTGGSWDGRDGAQVRR